MTGTLQAAVRQEAAPSRPALTLALVLDATGALATLLVVEGVVSLQDAANAVHEEPAHLEHEAQAW